MMIEHITSSYLIFSLENTGESTGVVKGAQNWHTDGMSKESPLLAEQGSENLITRMLRRVAEALQPPHEKKRAAAIEQLAQQWEVSQEVMQAAFDSYGLAFASEEQRMTGLRLVLVSKRISPSSSEYQQELRNLEVNIKPHVEAYQNATRTAAPQ